jgi:hypothetical protein
MIDWKTELDALISETRSFVAAFESQKVSSSLNSVLPQEAAIRN